jgi:DNA-directed RNA polymerase subunit beta
MQRQAVPLIHPEAPLVSTGMEEKTAYDSGELVVARKKGKVKSVTSERIIVETPSGEEVYRLKKFVRTNQGTCINYYPIVGKGEEVEEGQVLADGSAMQGGELALGRNVLVAFMSWEGYNYEDAIVISESLVRDDRLSSIHIEEYECESRDTKVGPEEITRDIPNVGEEALRNLDERGIVRVGAEVEQGDILVGKITPRGETELTAEAKLLRAIFGEKAREVKNSCLTLPHGERGTVIGVKEFTREDQNLPLGVNKLIKIWVAQRRKISEGDKLSGRHGNKGVVGKILPLEDMPYLHDGTPVEVILNPLGVPSRMNLGQVLETHLGLAAHSLGFKAITPIFEGASQLQVEDELARAWMMTQSGVSSPKDDKLREWLKARGEDYDHLFSDEHPGEARRACLKLWLGDIGVSCSPEKMEEVVNQVCKDKRISPPISGKATLYDGRTGEPFEQPIMVGYMYMMKLIHLVEDKIHARSTGPYSLITQQPLGGKAQFGGQRFGEMEVWALEAYGAAYTLQEMLTIKSDDIPSRSQTYEAIIRGEDINPPGIPESLF